MWDVKSKEVVSSRSLRRVVQGSQFTMASIEEINIRPRDILHRAAWGATQRKEREVRLGGVPPAPRDAPSTRSSKGRGLRITLKDLKSFGKLAGCPRCDYIEQHGNGKGCTVAHSIECHQRIAEELSRTEEGRARVQRAIQRKAAAAEKKAKPSSTH